jgi:hypothetical protein
MSRGLIVDRRVVAAVGLAALIGAACRGGAPHEESASTPPAAGRISLGRLDRANVYPTVAALGKTVAVAWNARNDLQSDVYVSVSTDGGATFGEAVRVNQLVKDASINGEQPARIAVAPGNIIHVVWPSRQEGRAVLRYASSTDSGRSFSTPSTIAGDGVSGIRGWQSVAIGHDGGVHALWLDGRHAATGPHHHGAHKPAAGAAPGTRMGKAPRQDVFHAAWKTDGPLRENAVVGDVCFCCKTAIATAGDRVFAAWRHIYPGSVRDIAVARSTDNGATFAAPVRLSEDNWKIDACPDDGPSMAADTHGGVHVAWPTLVAGDRPRKGIFYASLDGTGESLTFSPRLRLDAGDGDAAHPQIASDDHGNTAIVWDERPSGPGGQAGERRRIVLRRVSGGAAAPAETFEGAGVSYPAVAAAEGHWIVVWLEQTPDGSSMIAGRRVVF